MVHCPLYIYPVINTIITYDTSVYIIFIHFKNISTSACTYSYFFNYFILIANEFYSKLIIRLYTFNYMVS